MRHKDSDHAHMAWRSVKPVFSFRQDVMIFISGQFNITISYIESIKAIDNLSYVTLT